VIVWNVLQVEASFRSIDDPCYKHVCNLCIQFSSMLQFPCFCILELAQNASRNDVRYLTHHIRATSIGNLPREFYPLSFRVEDNFGLIQELGKKLFITLPTQDLIESYSIVKPHLKAALQYKGKVELISRPPIFAKP
jgi:hypothetical protein